MADLSEFATKDKADEGVIIPVKIDGKKLPLALKIYGSDSDVVKDYERQKIRKLGLGKKGKKDLDEDDIDELLENQDEAAIIRIGGIFSWDWKKSKIIENDPIILDGKTLGCEKSSYEFLCEKMPAIKDFIIENSNDRSNFLSLGKKN